MKRFLLMLGFLNPALAQAETATFDHRPILARIERDLDNGKILEKTGEAFDAMFRVAETELRKRGQVALANRLDDEWVTTGSDLLMAIGGNGDVGDHSPFSDWVQAWYAVIEAQLGIPVMEATHLRDIWVLNYTIPVVFHRDATSPWCGQVTAGDNCRDEYRRHFAGTKYQRDPDPQADKILHHGFAPVVAWWLVYAGCEAATQGGGMVVCGVAADSAEFAIERWVAPRIAYGLWDRANPNAAGPASGCPCCDDPDCDCCNGGDCDCPDCPCHQDHAQDDGDDDACPDCLMISTAGSGLMEALPMADGLPKQYIEL